MARKKKQASPASNHVLLSDEALQEVLANMPPELKIQFFKALENDLATSTVKI